MLEALANTLAVPKRVDAMAKRVRLFGTSTSKAFGVGMMRPVITDPHKYDTMHLALKRNWNFDAAAAADEEDANMLAAPIAELVQAPVTAALACLVPSAISPDRLAQLMTPALKASAIPMPTAALLEIGRRVFGAANSSTFRL